MDALGAVLKRDRLIIGAGIVVIAALAWWSTIRQAQQMDVGGISASSGMEMGAPDPMPWSAGVLLPLFLMWAVMMVAMMLPSATPMILTFASVARNRRRHQRPYVPVAVFVSGYIVIWCGFSVTATLAQWLLHREALLSPMMASSNALLGGILLFLAAVFQFTSLKQSCLTYCRSPLEFVTTRWREGWDGAFAMGIEHGIFCTGCCWALMGLLFVLGVMNLFWIAALGIFVGLEKMLPRPIGVSRLSGLLLAVWAIWIVVGA